MSCIRLGLHLRVERFIVTSIQDRPTLMLYDEPNTLLDNSDYTSPW